MQGYIYCFNTKENPNIIKAGQTQQDVKQRLRGYIGPTKPRHIFFQEKVDDCIKAETMMLDLMCQCVSLTKRNDLGNEWFETNGDYNFEKRAIHLDTIAKIVKMASRDACIPEVRTVVAAPSEATGAAFQPEAKTLRGLETYFENFDRYITEQALHCTDPLTLLKNYESSSFCIYGNFCKFLPFSEKERVKVIENRYAEFITNS